MPCDLIPGILQEDSGGRTDTGSDSDSNIKLRSPQYHRSVSAKKISACSRPQFETSARRLFFYPARTAESWYLTHHCVFSDGQETEWPVPIFSLTRLLAPIGSQRSHFHAVGSVLWRSSLILIMLLRLNALGLQDNWTKSGVCVVKRAHYRVMPPQAFR